MNRPFRSQAGDDNDGVCHAGGRTTNEGFSARPCVFFATPEARMARGTRTAESALTARAQPVERKPLCRSGLGCSRKPSGTNMGAHENEDIYGSEQPWEAKERRAAVGRGRFQDSDIIPGIRSCPALRVRSMVFI